MNETFAKHLAINTMSRQSAQVTKGQYYTVSSAKWANWVEITKDCFLEGALLP